MTRFGRFVFVVVLALTPLCLPRAARAQRFVGFAGGANVAQGPALPFQSLSAGFAAQAFLGYRIAPRLRIRLDALVSRFTAANTGFFLAVPQCLACVSAPSLPPTGPVGVSAVVANEIIDVFPSADGGPGLYLIAGGGAYYMFQNPSAPKLMRVGLSGGGGLELPIGGRARLVFEVRYHGLANAPTDARWFVPLTVGMRF